MARSQVRDAREIVGAVLEKRRRQKAALQAQGEKEIEFNDAIEWFEEAAKGTYYDPAISQLMMSFSAIHTSAEYVFLVFGEFFQRRMEAFLVFSPFFIAITTRS